MQGQAQPETPIRQEFPHSVESVRLLKKEDLPTLELVAKDKSRPLTPDNAEIYYNGLRLDHVQAVSIDLNVKDLISTVSVTLYANVVVRTETE